LAKIFTVLKKQEIDLLILTFLTEDLINKRYGIYKKHKS